MSEFGNLLAAGLTSGAIYGIFGACLAVWFRVCNVLNLAVGDFAMFGAIGTAWLVQTGGLPFVAGIVIVLAGVGLTAWIFDRLVLHFAFDRNAGAHGIVSVFFYTFGLSLVLEGAARAMFGTDVFGAPAIWPGPALAVADFHLQRAGVLVIGVAEAMLGGYVSTSYNDVLLYAILFGIIIFRPEVLGLSAEPA